MNFLAHRLRRSCISVLMNAYCKSLPLQYERPCSDFPTSMTWISSPATRSPRGLVIRGPHRRRERSRGWVRGSPLARSEAGLAAMSLRRGPLRFRFFQIRPAPERGRPLIRGNGLARARPSALHPSRRRVRGSAPDLKRSDPRFPAAGSWRPAPARRARQSHSHPEE